MRVIVSLPEKDNEYQVLQTSEAVETARAAGLDLDILYAENTAVLQIQQILRALRTEPLPRALIVEPVATEALDRVVAKAAAAGLGVAILNSAAMSIDRLRAEYPAVPIFTVESDQREIGRIQGRQIRSLVAPGSTVLYLHGPQGATAAQDRYQGLRESIEGHDLRVVVLDGQWTEESAERAVRSWLRLKTSDAMRVDIVAAQDDSMARGARNATAGAPETVTRWSRIPYLGIDGVPEVGQRLVNEGRLSATVVMPSNTGAALQHLARWLKHGMVPPPSVVQPVRSYPAEASLRIAQKGA
jgi:ribose transport system substrate-binding protein